MYHRPQRLHRRPRQGARARARSREPVSPDLEICARHRPRLEVAGRRAGAAVRAARPASTCRSPSNLFGSIEAHVPGARRRRRSTISPREIDELMTPKMPAGMLDALKMLPMVGRLRDLMPKTVKDAPCQEVVAARRHARRAADPEVLARGRRPLHHACRWSSRRIPRPACATSAPTACRCSTAARPACTGSGTRAARSTTASPSGWASGSTVAVALGPDPVLPYCATAPMPEGLDELLLGGFLRARARRAGQVRHRRSRSAGQRADRARRLRRAGRAAPRRARSAITPGFYSQPDDYPVFHLTCITQRKQPDLPDDRRRHSADGGLLPRHGERADLPAADPQDAAGDRRHALSGGGHLPQPRARLDRQALSRATRARS